MHQGVYKVQKSSGHTVFMHAVGWVKTVFIVVSCRRCLSSMGYWALCYEPIIPIQPIRALFTWLGSKSDMFLFGIQLCQSCPLPSPYLWS